MSKFRLALSLFLLFVSVQTAVAVSVPELDSLDRYIGLKKCLRAGSMRASTKKNGRLPCVRRFPPT